MARALDSGWTLRADDEAIGNADTDVRLMLTEHFATLLPWKVE
jgi:hypothetical protein